MPCLHRRMLRLHTHSLMYLSGWFPVAFPSHAGRPRPRPHCVRWGPSSPLKGHISVVAMHMAGWIKITLGTEVGLDQGDFVLDGDPAPLPKMGHSPKFLAHVYYDQTARWVKLPLGREVGMPRRHCVRWGPSSPLPPPPKNGGTASNFWSMSIVAKRLDGSRCHLVRR